ncbi:hypothetical protein ABIA48_004553 [Pseudomonas sp. S30_BP2TU TE3576]
MNKTCTCNYCGHVFSVQKRRRYCNAFCFHSDPHNPKAQNPINANHNGANTNDRNIQNNS